MFGRFVVRWLIALFAGALIAALLVAAVLPPEELRELIATCLGGLKERTAALFARLKDGDRVQLGREAHALAGVAGNFGLKRVAALARRLETLCAGLATAEIAGLVASIIAASPAATAALEAYAAQLEQMPAPADAAQ